MQNGSGRPSVQSAARAGGAPLLTRKTLSNLRRGPQRDMHRYDAAAAASALTPVWGARTGVVAFALRRSRHDGALMRTESASENLRAQLRAFERRSHFATHTARQAS